MLCTPKPNGFADQTIPMKKGYFIGKINPTFSVTNPCGVEDFLSFRFSVWTHSESPLSTTPPAALRSTASVRVFAPVTVVLEAGLQDALEEDKRWWQILEAQMSRCRCVSIYIYIYIYVYIYVLIYIYAYIYKCVCMNRYNSTRSTISIKGEHVYWI